MLSPSLATFLITLINLGILFFILRALLWRPVSKFMEERSRRIAESLDQAERDKTQAKRLLEQYEARLREAEGEGESIIRAAREQAREEAERIIAQSREEAAALLTRSRSQLAADEKAALAAFKAEAAALVVRASGRLLERELTGEDKRHQAALILSGLTEEGRP